MLLAFANEINMSRLDAYRVKDFYLQVSAPCRAHQTKAPGDAEGPVLQNRVVPRLLNSKDFRTGADPFGQA